MKKKKARLICKTCGISLRNNSNMRHQPGKGWLFGIDALEGTYYGDFGFCRPGCQMVAIMKKLRIAEVKFRLK